MWVSRVRLGFRRSDPFHGQIEMGMGRMGLEAQAIHDPEIEPFEDREGGLVQPDHIGRIGHGPQAIAHAEAAHAMLLAEGRDGKIADGEGPAHRPGREKGPVENARSPSRSGGRCSRSAAPAPPWSPAPPRPRWARASRPVLRNLRSSMPWVWSAWSWVKSTASSRLISASSSCCAQIRRGVDQHAGAAAARQGPRRAGAGCADWPGCSRPRSCPTSGTPPEPPQPSTVTFIARPPSAAGLGEEPEEILRGLRGRTPPARRRAARPPVPRYGRRRPARCACRDTAPAPDRAHRSRPAGDPAATSRTIARRLSALLEGDDARRARCRSRGRARASARIAVELKQWMTPVEPALGGALLQQARRYPRRHRGYGR